MAKFHETVRSSPSAKGLRAFSASLTGGNGSVVKDDADRLARIEDTLIQMQKALETQFARTSALQAQVDRLAAEQRDRLR